MTTMRQTPSHQTHAPLARRIARRATRVTAVVLLATTGASCFSDGLLNVDPNRSTTADPALLFTAAEVKFSLLRAGELTWPIALKSQIEELEDDTVFYDKLRSGQISAFSADSLHDLPDILIQARIARGMSQKDLGTFLGLKEQQIQRYEAERYR